MLLMVRLSLWLINLLRPAYFAKHWELNGLSMTLYVIGQWIRSLFGYPNIIMCKDYSHPSPPWVKQFIKAHGGVRYGSTHTSPQHWKEKSGHIRTLEALWLGRAPGPHSIESWVGPRARIRHSKEKKSIATGACPQPSHCTANAVRTSNFDKTHICGHTARMNKTTAVIVLGLLKLLI